MTDRAAFERLALVHMDAAFNLAFALLRSRADAEDAVQDALIRAYRAFHQLQGESVKPWLLTIVRNVCYRHLQDRRRSGNVISLDETFGGRPGVAVVEEDLSTAEPSPEEAAIQSSEHAMLSAAIGQLPPAFREVIILREIEELSYREVAEIIGAPVGTVMSRLSRARSELRTLVTQSTERGGKDAM
jgi:RNA polymerase sigma-70 factor, ECF subfamily